MTEQRWQNIRNLSEIPMDVWFEYYRENGGFIQHMDQFKDIFLSILSNDTVLKNSKGELVTVNLKTSLKRLYEYYNHKFKT